MGQQQLLLIILGVIIVGIAIAVGLSLFSAQSIQANKDAIINDLNNLAAYCYQQRIRPISMGGCGGDYGCITTNSIPAKLRSNDNATYSVTVTGTTQITLQGASTADPTQGTVTATLTSDGTLSTWVYGLYFQ
jgi:hypothetical protein